MVFIMVYIGIYCGITMVFTTYGHLGVYHWADDIILNTGGPEWYHGESG